jgi:HPt (histidine-containing phosphotransfer) domain-containing protein
LLQESAKSAEADADTLYYLGMSQFYMDRQPQTTSALERSLAAGLQEPLASEAKRVLATLNKPKS